MAKMSSPINTVYAWRLLAEYLRSPVPPKHGTCNPSFSPLSLHMSALSLSLGHHAPAATAELRYRLRWFLCSNGFGQHAHGSPGQRQAQKTAIYAAMAALAPSDGDGPGAYLSKADWANFPHSSGFTLKTGKHTSRSADFQNNAAKVRDDLNSWIRRTYDAPMPKNLIPKDSVGADSQFISGNVFKFFGQWAPELRLKLDASGDGEKGCSDFYMLNGQSMSVPFMTSKEPQWIASYPGFKALRVPYKKGKYERQFSMCVFLPDDHRDGVFDLLEKLTNESGFLERHLPARRVLVREFKVPIKRGTVALKTVGMVWPPQGTFDPYCFSTFVFLEFADKTKKGRGKKKAAVVKSAGSSGATSVDFVADHAFLYAIRDDVSGTVLMIGLVNNPGCVCSVLSGNGVDSSRYEESDDEDSNQTADSAP